MFILSEDKSKIVNTNHCKEIFCLNNGIYAKNSDGECVVFALYDNYIEEGKVIATGNEIARSEFRRLMKEEKTFMFFNNKSANKTEVVKERKYELPQKKAKKIKF